MKGFKRLGTGQVQDLVVTLREDGVLAEELAEKVCVEIPRSMLDKIEGLAPYLPTQQLTGSEDLKAEEGWNEDAPHSNLELSDRKYRIRRLAHRMPYNQAFEGDRVFDQAKDELVPAIDRKLNYKLDVLHLAPILKGQGSADDSRDVSTFAVPGGSKFDDDDSNVLGMTKDAVDATGGDIIVIGRDVAQALAGHPQIVDSIFRTQGGSGEVTHGALATYLEDRFSLQKVIIGNAGYQGGSQYFSLNIDYGFDGVFYVGQKANCALLRWSNGKQWKDYETKASNQVWVQGENYVDIVTFDPDASMAFEDILS